MLFSKVRYEEDIGVVQMCAPSALGMLRNIKGQYTSNP